MKTNPKHLPDQELLNLAKILCADERRAQNAQIPVFCEIVRRRLFAKQGYSSLFTYLVEELGFSKGCAFKRNVIARATAQFPQLMSMLEDGRYTLASAALVAKDLTSANYEEIFKLTTGKSAAEIELILATRLKRKPGRDRIRILGAPEEAAPKVQSTDDKKSDRSVSGEEAAPVGPNDKPSTSLDKAPAPDAVAPPAQVELNPEDVLVQVTFFTNKKVKDKLSRVRDLLARRLPQGELSDVFEEVLDDYLARHDPLVKAERAAERTAKKNGAAAKELAESDEAEKRFPGKPRSEDRFAREPRGNAGRYIPAAVRHAVIRRDGGRCTHVGPDGRRCGERRYLDLDHIRPFALGGKSTDVANIRLLCRVHNMMRARETFGEKNKRDGDCVRIVGTIL